MARLDDRFVTGTFDRVHLWHDAGKPTRAILVDYKTDRVDDDSIDAAAGRYADQLRLYRQALSIVIGLDEHAISTNLYFVGDSRVVLVE